LFAENHYYWKIIGRSANSTEGRIRRRREKKEEKEKKKKEKKEMEKKKDCLEHRTFNQK
jgi:hypothetical protein